MDQLNMFTDISNKNVEICQCCGGKVKTWKKPLIGVAVADLIRLYNLYYFRKEPVHVDRFSKQRSNFYTLKYWGLIIGSAKVKGKRTAGLWSPTKKGIEFVQGEITLPSHAITKNNILIRFTGKEKSVRQALGKKFNYDELIFDLKKTTYK